MQAEGLPESSRWQGRRRFHWQGGYGAFSIGESQVSAVTEYIGEQKERHKTMSFEDELVALANRYGVAFDTRYLWS